MAPKDKEAGAAGARNRLGPALMRSWVELTPGEQKALVLIVGLFLLGLTVRWWHLHWR